MKALAIIVLFLGTVVSSIHEVAGEDEGPILIAIGKGLNYSLAVKIVLSIFLLLAFTDFLFQTFLLYTVFCQLVVKVRTKSEIFCSVFGVILYTLIRCSFVFYIVLPIPWDWAPDLPRTVVDVIVYTNTTLFLTFFTLPFLTCIYYVAFVGISGKRDKRSLVDPGTGIEPMVVVLMPIYNEEPDALFRAVESAIRCNYRSDRLHVFLAFDEASETSLFFALLKKLKVLSKEVSEEIKAQFKLIPCNNDKDNEPSVNMSIEIFPPRMEWYIEGVRVTICRFPHEGKSPTQGKSFKIINDMYGGSDMDPANTLVLFIDSDIILHENAINNFVAAAVANPKIKGMTGLVTCRTSRTFNIYQYLQDAEYIEGQMFSRTCEASLGAVTCLPGALTLMRLNALQQVAPKYFIEIDKRRTVDFHRFHLGEDRYMTYLLTEASSGPYQVNFISSATCKTDAPDTFGKLLKQRRRWFLGGFVNDISTIISPVMWRKVPFVVLISTYSYASRGLAWILPVMLISVIASGENPGLAMYIIVGTLIIKYLLLIINAVIMTRRKVCFSYILLFFFSLIFNWIVSFYAVWTWNTRSWGGPRTDQDAEEISKLDILEDVMTQKEEKIGKTRKSLGQIKTMGRLLESRIRRTTGNGNDSGGSLRSTRSVLSTISKMSASSNKSGAATKGREAPVKKFVPFPYESEFLGGSDFDLNKSSHILIPPTPTFTISLSPTASIRSHRPPNYPQSPNFLTPRSSFLSKSVPDDLHTLTNSNAPYLFSKLSPETQRRASSFKLDREYLAKIEALATADDSQQRKSSFNIRLSGRESNAEDNDNTDIDLDNSPTSSAYEDLTNDFNNNDDVVDIVIHVPDIY